MTVRVVGTAGDVEVDEEGPGQARLPGPGRPW